MSTNYKWCDCESLKSEIAWYKQIAIRRLEIISELEDKAEKAESELARLKERNRKFLDNIRENLPNPNWRYDTVEYADMLHRIDKIYDKETEVGE